MSHTVRVIAAGFALPAVCLLAGRLRPATAKPRSSRESALVFVALWFVGAGINMWVGVSRAGYSAKEEAPIFLVVFLIPPLLRFSFGGDIHGVSETTAVGCLPRERPGGSLSCVGRQPPVYRVTRQIVVTAIGAALVSIGSAIALNLLAQGWSWGLGILALVLILEGIDCLYVGITGRNGASPVLLVWVPWI